MNNKPINYALAQISVVPGRPDINYKRAWIEAEAAALRGIDVLLLPEMFGPGYLLGDFFEDDYFIRDIEAWNTWFIEKLSTISLVVIFGTIVADWDKKGRDGRVRKYNAALVVQNGKIITDKNGRPFAIKTNQPDYGIFDDSRHFFSQIHVAIEQEISIKKLVQPFELTIRELPICIGVMLCEDGWQDDYSVKPGEILVENGAEILADLSTSPWSWHKNQKRDAVMKSLVERVHVPLLYINCVGSQNNGKNFIPFDGAVTVYDATGAIIFLAPLYVDAVFDFNFTEYSTPLFREELSDVQQLRNATHVNFKGYCDVVPEQYRQHWIVGGSGGKDSSLTILMLVDNGVPLDAIKVYNLPYRNYNDTDSMSDVATLCKNLGIKGYEEKPINDMVDAAAVFSGILRHSPQHKSIQARMRDEALAMMSSVYHGQYTANSNSTETAFGFFTLGGDGRGYYCPWGNNSVRSQYELLHYYNDVVFKEAATVLGHKVVPEGILRRPPADGLNDPILQLRSADPFHYGNVGRNGYHDQLDRAFRAFRRNPEWILERYYDGTLEHSENLDLLPGTIDAALHDLYPHMIHPVERFIFDLEQKYTAFVGMVFKRIQSPPISKLDKRSFGFDYRESMLPVYFTRGYLELKAEMLAQ